MGKDGYLVNPAKPPKKENADTENTDSIERKNKKEQLQQELKSIEEEEKKDSIQKKSQAAEPEPEAYIKKEEANTKVSIYSPLSFAALFN